MIKGVAVKFIQYHGKGWKRPDSGDGRYVNKAGYVMLRMPDHPAAQGGYVLEHRYLMEQSIGRLLNGRAEHVHHLNHDRADNRLENLQIIDPGSHMSHHHLGRVHPPRTAEYRANKAETMKRLWAARRAGELPMPDHEGRPQSAEHRAKESAAAKRSWASGQRKKRESH